MRKVDLKTSVQDWATFQPSTPTFDMVRRSKTGYEFLYVVSDSDSKPTKDEDDEFMKETWARVAGATLVQPGWYRRESVVIAYARYSAAELQQPATVETDAAKTSTTVSVTRKIRKGLGKMRVSQVLSDQP